MKTSHLFECTLLSGDDVGSRENWIFGNRMSTSKEGRLEIDLYDHEEHVLYSCPRCEKNELYEIWNENGVFPLEYIDGESHLNEDGIDCTKLRICKRCIDELEREMKETCENEKGIHLCEYCIHYNDWKNIKVKDSNQKHEYERCIFSGSTIKEVEHTFNIHNVDKYKIKKRYSKNCGCYQDDESVKIKITNNNKREKNNLFEYVKYI